MDACGNKYRSNCGYFYFKPMLYRNQRKPAPSSSEYYSPAREGSSPTRGSVLLQEDCLQYVDSLAGRKDNLRTCLDLYKLSFQNDLPQKCFPHNNFITLYCQNEQKLLCVNCIYGSAIHKNHRVVPSKNSLKNIQRDNEESIKLLEDEVERIRSSQSELIKNNSILSEQYKRVLNSLDEEFQRIKSLVETKHIEMRQKAMEAFSRANQNNQIGKEEATWWKNYLSSLRNSLPKSDGSQQVEIYKHLSLESLKKEKLDMEKLTYIASPQQITSEFLSEVYQLRQTIQNRLIGAKPVKNKVERIKLF